MTSAMEACDFSMPSSQGKNYHTTGFTHHAGVAQVVGDQMSRVFYDDATEEWLISPRQLRDLVLTNILQDGGDDGEDASASGHGDSSSSSSSNNLHSEYPIYGSAIAFEPNGWPSSNDGALEDGVTYPAASQACLDDVSYSCTEEAKEARMENKLRVTELERNNEGQTVYSPYAFRGPANEIAYQNCSRDQPEYCPSIDLAQSYDYANVSLTDNEWYTAPRCLYLRDGIESGYWTSPYFDAGAGEINMVTYSQPIISPSAKFLGVVTIDVTVDALCYGEQCNVPIDYNYLENIRSVGFTFVALAMAASLGCMAWTQVYNRNPVVIASQPFFLRLICLGCFIMASSIIPLSIDDSMVSAEGCSKACMAFPWLLSIGFTTTFSALFSKIWRLNRVLQNSRNFRRVKVKEMDVIMPFAVLITLNCALMAAWTIVDPLVWVRTEPIDYESYGNCQAQGESYAIFLVLIAIVNLLALVMANVQSFRARNASTEFSESLYITMAMISLLQLIVIGVPLMVIVQGDNIASYFIVSGFIFVMTTAVLGLMFVPKMLSVKHGSTGAGSAAESNYSARQSTPRPNTENDSRLSKVAEEDASIVVIGSTADRLEAGNQTIMTGKF